MPILGVIASGISGHLSPASDYVLLGRATASTSVSNLTVSGIDQSYSHLEIWIHTRTSRGAINDANILTFNGVSSGVANYYANNEVNGNGSAYFSRGGSTSAFSMFAGETVGNSGSTSGAFGFTLVQLFDYSSSTKNKSAWFMGGNNQNLAAGTSGGANNTWHQVTWNTAQAITDIVMTPNTGPNFVAGSILSVYGAR